VELSENRIGLELIDSRDFYVIIQKWVCFIYSSSVSSLNMSSISICSHPPWPAPDPRPRAYRRPYEPCRGLTEMLEMVARNPSPRQEERARKTVKRRRGMKKRRVRRSHMFMIELGDRA